jgi:sterol desaturase/sphingolipid hydroxylase (fatty acid hydroxylase superfamily)
VVVLLCCTAFGSLNFWNGDVATNIALKNNGQYNPYKEVNEWINDLFFTSLHLTSLSDWAIAKFGPENGYFVQCYLRDLVAGTAVYWITAGVWHFVIYNVMVQELFIRQGRSLPTWETLADQMCLAQASLFMYAGLPILSEYIIEKGYTKVYFYIDEVGGWGMYFAYLALYLLFVEFGIYWVHRTLHTNKFLYKYVHGLHHKYNKAVTLTPWCSIAFNPIDGLAQVSACAHGGLRRAADNFSPCMY